MSQCLEQSEVSGGKTVKYVVQLKSEFGFQMIDLRKWMQYPNQPDYLPSRTKGICIPVSKWPIIIERINKMIAESSANTTENR